MCCCFQVTAPEVASLNLAFAVDDVFQSATLNGEPLTDFKVPTDGKLEGKIDAGSALFKLGTNVLVVEVLNTGANAFGFYAEGSAITGTNAVSSRPRAQRESPPARNVAATHGIGWLYGPIGVCNNVPIADHVHLRERHGRASRVLQG